MWMRWRDCCFDDTSGYPFLVSRLCQLMDEVVCKKETYGSKSAAWTKEGFYEAQRLILAEKTCCLSL